MERPRERRSTATTTRRCSRQRETLASMQCRLVPLSEIVFPHVGQKVADGKLVAPASLSFLAQQRERFFDDALTAGRA